MGAETLKSRIESATARVAVVGLGYVGAPLAALAVDAGFAVEGIDPYRDGPPEGLAGLGRFSFNRDYSAIPGSDVVVVCVPTPLTENEEPDLGPLIGAFTAIAENFGARDRGPRLLVVESTSFPGTTSEIVEPVLREAGLTEGEDFHLAYAPERVDPGPATEKRRLKDIPRVVGGRGGAAGELAEVFYRRLGCEVKRVSAPEIAEMSKLLENVFRAVNIALVNEISLLCRKMDIDVWEVLEAAATKPFGFMPFRPGPGIGGHCIPVDPFYLSWKARQYGFYTEFIELAGKMNRNMPRHVVEWIAERLNEDRKSLNGSRVLVVGIAYKEDVADVRESPALKIIELLARAGAEVLYHDALVGSVEVDGRPYSSAELSAEVAGGCDCVAVITAHSDVDRGLLKSLEVPVVDVRNALGRHGR